MANDFSTDPHCIALWSFEDDSAGPIYDSQGLNHLTNSGVSSDTSDFKEGFASGLFVAASDDYMVIADANLDSGFPCKNGESNKSFSCAFWAKFTITTGFSQFVAFKGSPEKLSFLINLTSSKIGINTSSDGDSWTDGYWHDTALVKDIWYHVGITYDATDDSYRVRVWDDNAGAILGTDKTGTLADVFISDAPFYIGDNSTYYPLDARLDEFVLFNDVLSIGEIDAIRETTFPFIFHNAIIVEAASATDASVARADFNSDITESTTAEDVSDRTLVIDAAITETGTAEDVSDANIEFNATITEAATAEDAQAVQADFNSDITESGTAEDIPNAGADYHIGIVEAATAADASSVSRKQYVAIIEAATALDAPGGHLVLDVMSAEIIQSLVDPYTGGAWV